MSAASHDQSHTKPRIAIIGSGISGLSAAWLLKDRYQVTLFESEPRLGGHARTIQVPINGTPTPVDTGFMVYNPKTYPNLCAFFNMLGIQHTHTSMKFSVSTRDGSYEYMGSVPRGIFVQIKNIVSLDHWRVLFHIVRFNWIATRALRNGLDTKEATGVFLDRHGFPPIFRERYLYPMAGCIWSSASASIADFPADALLKFLENHDLLATFFGMQWRTVSEGSISYVNAVQKSLETAGAVIQLNAPVLAVSRSDSHATITTAHGSETFDYVVCATHADRTLSIITDPTEDERAILGAFTYHDNTIVVHDDPSFMPQRRGAWAAWNYRVGKAEAPISLTYWMNALQHIQGKDIFVTMNPERTVESHRVYNEVILRHIQMDSSAIAAQPLIKTIQGVQRTFFCGSYHGYGFHEDGIRSAIDALTGLEITPPWK
jgi:uncharacterized protein